MRRSLLLAFALMCSFAVSAQTTYSYYFSNNLHESSGSGPDLMGMCTGSYSSETLPAGVTKDVYHFNKGCGIIFHDAAGFLSSGSYTIEMYFELDTVQGYKKIIDYDSLRQDKGLYNQSGTLALYSVFSSAKNTYFSDSTYTYLAITRDGATGMMHLYINDTSVGSYNDTGNLYVYDTSNLLIFLRDDRGTGGEQTTGSVAMIKISNQALDSVTIHDHFANLPVTLDVPNTYQSNNNVHIYPNPATDYVHVTVAQQGSYSISDITGKVLLHNSLQKGDNALSVRSIAPGMYFLKVTDNDGQESQVFKIIKE